MKNLYLVGRGDSLQSIATKFSLSSREILSSNKIKEDNIRVGTILVIDKVDGERYVVKPFDTIDNIANKYSISPKALAEYNKITQVFLGEIIYIPTKPSSDKLPAKNS